jgi:lipopolysaccharide transport system ATP-binding protein
MSSESPALSLRGVCKTYRVRGTRPASLTAAVAERVRHPVRRALAEVVALSDVTLDVCQGETVGVIGPNGAGKSTLLRILARIVTPTRGRIEVYGRVGSLLEMGTGFNPELTGRENIYLNGALLGMKRAEIARLFDSIVEFAAIERFLETPVKRYSTGMYVRLAFAVAAHLRPDILLVDEVLSVGDHEFQKRCLSAMKHASSEHGTAVLLVSHNLDAVHWLCHRAVVLRSGQIDYDGPASAVQLFEAGSNGGAGEHEPRRRVVPLHSDNTCPNANG